MTRPCFRRIPGQVLQSSKVLSLSELPPHAEPDNKNPPKIDLKSEIDLDPHAITGNSNDINLLKFA